MGGISTWEMLVDVMWLARDFMVPGALLLAVLGLFSKRDCVNAIWVWALGFVGTAVTLADRSKDGLFDLPDELVIAGLVLAAVLIVIGVRKHRPLFTRQANRQRRAKSYTQHVQSRFSPEPAVPERKGNATSTSGEGQALAPPLCPKCGSAMVIRVAQTGTHKGKRFYGCTNYPQCRGIRPLE